MNFASDNWAGASPKVLAAAMAAMAAGPAPAYGGDAWTRRAEEALCALFEREVRLFLVASGTAANVLGVAHVTPPWGAVYCHAQAHINTSECGALEGAAGLKLVPLAGDGGKVAPAALEEALAAARRGDAHAVQPATLSITNLTECGTRYRPRDVADLAAICRRSGLRLHLDGARFANAVAAEGCSAADLSWRAGVDVMALGATKCGSILAEAVVFFDLDLAEGFSYRRMRGGQLLSKTRFVAAQFEAWLAAGHWLELASHSNRMAQRLAAGLVARGGRLAWPVEGNMVFAVHPAAVAARLRAAGATFHPWPGTGVELAADEGVFRHVCAFSTTVEEVDAFLAVVRGG